MALEASFRELDARLQAAREAFGDLRVVLVEDGPDRGAPALLDRLGDAATDLVGWFEEAADAAAEGVRHSGRPRDLEAAQAALLVCQERLLQIAQRFTADLFNCEQVAEIHDLGRERGRSWRLWTTSVKKALGHCQDGLLETGRALLDCWKEIAELSGASGLSVRATGIGQQITLFPAAETGKEREQTAPEREQVSRVRRAAG